jgi:adenylosuccinate synthase
VQICSAYRLDGETIDYVPSSNRRLARVAPLYESSPGWSAPTRGVSDWQALPAGAAAYVERLAALIGVPVTLAGTGPGRLALARRPQR